MLRPRQIDRWIDVPKGLIASFTQLQNQTQPQTLTVYPLRPVEDHCVRFHPLDIELFESDFLTGSRISVVLVEGSIQNVCDYLPAAPLIPAEYRTTTFFIDFAAAHRDVAPHRETYDTAGTIIRKIDEVVVDDEMYDDEEPRPPQDVIRGVKKIISEASRFLPWGRFPIALVRPFDGSIRITWATESGSVRLVCAGRDSVACEISYHRQISVQA